MSLFNNILLPQLLIPPWKITTIEKFEDWLANTDAEIIYVGKPIGDLSSLSRRAALTTIVTYCNQRIGNRCGGNCTVYNGGATCLAAPNTNCLFATNNVGFCDFPGCDGSCNQFTTCRTRLENNFCWTPCWEDSRVLLTRAELLCSLADANSAAALAQWYKW